MSGFEPWIGSEYKSGFRPYLDGVQAGATSAKRTLILGESYYQKDNPLGKNFTKNLVKEQIAGIEKRQRFFSNVGVVMTSQRLDSPEKRGRLWNSVAHYCYVQDPVGQKARIRPSKKMWADASARFMDVVKELRPQFILVLGYGLWDYLPGGTSPTSLVETSFLWPEACKRRLTRWFPTGDSGLALAYGIPHPSSGRFSGKRWHPCLMQAIQQA